MFLKLYFGTRVVFSALLQLFPNVGYEEIMISTTICSWSCFGRQSRASLSPASNKSLFDFYIGHLAVSTCTVICSLHWSIYLWLTDCWPHIIPWVLLHFWPLDKNFQHHLVLLWLLPLCSKSAMIISMSCFGMWSISSWIIS